MTLPPTSKQDPAQTPEDVEKLIWRNPDGQVFLMWDRKDWKTTVKPRIPKEGINSGFFIAHGHFIPRPYKIDRDGDSITINNMAVGRLPALAEKPGLVRLKDPGDFAWPKGYRGDPPGFSEYLLDKWRYLRQEHGEDPAARMLADIIARQPGIAKVEVLDRFTIRYECVDGEKMGIGGLPPKESLVSRADQDLEYRRRDTQLREFLVGGGMLIISTPTGRYEGNSLTIWLPPDDASATLRSIVNVMQSDADMAQRFEQLAAILEEPNVAREMAENLEVNDVLRKAAGQ